jgi:hypothetical protein
MVEAEVTRLCARVRLLSDPPLWTWEIVEATTGTVVESSWESEWRAYPSAAEALRQAAPALSRLTRGPRLGRSGSLARPSSLSSLSTGG